MTLTDELKILGDKIKVNQAQCNLDRETAKISALSSKELDKYEYLTGEDLGCKPGVVEKVKFDYSPLGEVFDKELDEKDKKEGLLKSLKNIESKNEEQLKEIGYQGERQLDMIDKQGKEQLKAIRKQEEQLKTSKRKKKQLIKKIEKENKSKEIILLKGNLNEILMNFNINFTNKGEVIL